MVHHGDVYTHCKDVPMMSYCVLTMAHMIFRSLASKSPDPHMTLGPFGPQTRESTSPPICS